MKRTILLLTAAMSLMLAVAQTGDLPRSTPAEQGLSAMAVNQFVDSLMALPDTEIHHAMVVRHGHVVAEDTVRSTGVYLMAYVLILAVSVLLISPDGFDFTTNFTAVAATFNNIGPGLAGVGPTRNYFDYSVFSKIVLIFDMLAGRLELFPLLILFKAGCWKKY